MIGNSETLVGTWKLVSCVLEDVETKEQKPVWGANPNGYIVMTPGGRWIVIQTAEGRDPPQNDEDRIAACAAFLFGRGNNEVRLGSKGQPHASPLLHPSGCQFSSARPLTAYIGATDHRA
jgi:hypothetical protein